jgi:hypothetical protein
MKDTRSCRTARNVALRTPQPGRSCYASIVLLEAAKQIKLIQCKNNNRQKPNCAMVCTWMQLQQDRTVMCTPTTGRACNFNRLMADCRRDATNSQDLIGLSQCDMNLSYSYHAITSIHGGAMKIIASDMHLSLVSVTKSGEVSSTSSIANVGVC